MEAVPLFFTQRESHTVKQRKTDELFLLPDWMGFYFTGPFDKSLLMASCHVAVIQELREMMFTYNQFNDCRLKAFCFYFTSCLSGIHALQSKMSNPGPYALTGRGVVLDRGKVTGVNYEKGLFCVWRRDCRPTRHC